MQWFTALESEVEDYILNEEDKDQEATDARERLLPEKVSPGKVPTGDDGPWRAEAVATALEMSNIMHIEAGKLFSGVNPQAQAR